MKTLINKFRNRNNKQYPKKYDIRFTKNDKRFAEMDKPKGTQKIQFYNEETEKTQYRPSSYNDVLLRKVLEQLENIEDTIEDDAFSYKEFALWVVVIFSLFTIAMIAIFI